MDPDGKITIARGNTLGANGLALNASELYAAEGAGKLISRGNQNGRVATVLDKVGDEPLGAPNDIIFDSRGGFYFTDPGQLRCSPETRTAAGKCTTRPAPANASRFWLTINSLSQWSDDLAGW